MYAFRFFCATSMKRRIMKTANFWSSYKDSDSQREPAPFSAIKRGHRKWKFLAIKDGRCKQKGIRGTLILRILQNNLGTLNDIRIAKR